MPVWVGLALAALVGALLWQGARWFATASPRDLAYGLRAGLAGFATLAGTGLLLTGRIGMAVALAGAVVTAVRATRARGRGADPLPGAGDAASEIETTYLSMRLDRASGSIDGEVRTGALRGRRLRDLGEGQLVGLLETVGRDDPPSVPLLEAYLDRRYPEWRDAAGSGQAPAGGTGAMDEPTACSILGVGPGAGAEEIKAAHRRLMAKLHPDHGGSDYLAAQINRAKETLLRGARR